MDEYVSRCKGMDHLSRWLGAHYLGPFERALRDDIGVTEYDDLAYLEDKELVSIGVDRYRPSILHIIAICTYWQLLDWAAL